MPFLRGCAPCYFESGSLIDLQLTMRVSLSWLMSSGTCLFLFSLALRLQVQAPCLLSGSQAQFFKQFTTELPGWVFCLFCLVLFLFEFQKLHLRQSYKASIISDGDHLEHLMILVWHLEGWGEWKDS